MYDNDIIDTNLRLQTFFFLSVGNFPMIQVVECLARFQLGQVDRIIEDIVMFQIAIQIVRKGRRKGQLVRVR